MTVTDTFDLGDVTVTETTKGVAPTALDLVPVLPTQVDVYLADAQADLDLASPLERVLSATWGISNRFAPLFVLKSANGTSFETTVETEPALQCKLKMEADEEGMALLDTLRQGDTTFLRIKATGGVVDVGYNYDLQIDTALKVTDVSEFSDADGVYAIEWTLDGVHDPIWGKAVQVDVVNALTSL
jgi:hypothetical protein